MNRICLKCEWTVCALSHFSGTQAPQLFQLADVIPVNLRQRRILHPVLIAAVVGPLTQILTRGQGGQRE